MGGVAEPRWAAGRCHAPRRVDRSALGEARALVVGGLLEVTSPGLLVCRSALEGVETKSTKGRRSRRVPLEDRILPIVQAWAKDKGPDDLLVTTSRGARLHRTAVLRTLKWEDTGQSRRIHDLRHTAACLWLARGVDAGTVQQWLGHEASEWGDEPVPPLFAHRGRSGGPGEAQFCGGVPEGYQTGEERPRQLKIAPDSEEPPP